MEHLPTFDLNRAIHDWRTGLSKSPALRRDSLDELESHLRDSIATLAEKGLLEDEAFLIAVQRCGTQKQLQTEFSKSGSLQSLLAVLTGILVTTILVLAVEGTIITRANGVATILMMRQIWVLDILAAVVGGYVTALVARHSPVKHATAVAGLILPPLIVLGFLSSEPPLQILTTSLGFVVCICLGAIVRDWQRQRSRSCTA